MTNHPLIIGLDELLSHLQIQRTEKPGGYPPFNIENIETDKYRITLAIAGFSEDEISVVEHNSVLTVYGKKKNEEKTQSSRMLHQGIANRNFERKFTLAQYLNVKSATMENGLLNIDLKREIPESELPQKIKINS